MTNVYDHQIRDGNFYYYYQVYKPKSKKFKNLSILITTADGYPKRIYFARYARYKGNRQWLLYYGIEHRFVGYQGIEEHSFKKKMVYLPTPLHYFKQETRHPDAMDIRYLEKLIPLKRKTGLDTRFYEILYHERFAIPSVTLIVLFAGLLVGRAMGKATVAASLGITIVVVLVYFIVESVGKSLGKQGVLPISLGVWSANILFLLSTIGIMIRYKRYA